MKNSVKRILSLILAIVLAADVFCVSKPVRAQGVAQEEESMDNLEKDLNKQGNKAKDSGSDYDIWMAQTMIHGIDQGGDGLYPMFCNFSDPVYKQLGESLWEDKLQVILSAAWSGLFNNEFQSNFGNEKKYVYETLLMDYLTYDAKNSNVFEQLDNTELKFANKLLDLLKDATNGKDAIKGMSAEEAAEHLEKLAGKNAEIKKWNKFLSVGIEVGDTAEEFIDKYSEYMALQQVCEERIALLKSARDACENSASPDRNFIKAADDVIKCLKDSGEEYAEKKMASYAWKKCLEEGWGSLCNMNPVLKGIELGVAGLEVCFNTTNVASNELKLALLYTTDYYLKQGMLNAETSFDSSGTMENGQVFLACFQGYIQFQMYGNHFAESWLDDYLNNRGLLNEVNKLFHSENVQTANDLLSLSASQTENRKKLLQLIDKYSNIYWKINKKKEETDVVRDIVLVLDCSGSMDGEPINQTKEASLNFLDTVFEYEEASRISVVTYNSGANVDCELTDEKQALTDCIGDIYTGGSTNIYAGLEEADRMLQESTIEKKIIVLMSDGLPNEGISDSSGFSAPLLAYAEELKEKGYYIYTLGFFMSVDGSEIYSAQQLMEGIASPGLHFEVDSADDLVFFFEDIANQISGAKYVHIRIACPVDVTVSNGEDALSSKADSENTRTSFGSLTYETIQSEDENGNLIEDQAKILRLNMEKDYDVQIEGYGIGTMDYTVSFPDDSGEYVDVREFPGIEVTDVTKATSNTNAADATYLKVDQNGDGQTDVTYKTESNGTMEEVKDNTVLYIVLAAVVIFSILLLILIIVIVRSSKKKNQGNGTREATGEIYGAFGIFQGKRYPIGPGEKCTVGRKTMCDIQLVHGQVSRVHCIIEMLPDGVYQVTDCSSNGTFYNDQKLKSRQPYRLPKGALLAIGDADNILELR